MRLLSEDSCLVGPPPVFQLVVRLVLGVGINVQNLKLHNYSLLGGIKCARPPRIQLERPWVQGVGAEEQRPPVNLPYDFGKKLRRKNLGRCRLG
jgi:hypothetical protein